MRTRYDGDGLHEKFVLICGLCVAIIQPLFTDITSGNNNCCAYSGPTPSKATCCDAGFTATTSWDPVTVRDRLRR
jgi:hypothetical protein